MTKRCPKCGEDKPLTEEFWSWIADRRTGHRIPRYICKRCRVKQQSEYAKKNPEKIKQFRDKPEQKEKEKARHRKYYIRNKDRMNRQSAEWARNNPEKRKDIYTRYYQKNRQKVIASAAMSAKLNPDKIREARIRRYKRLSMSPSWRDKRNSQTRSRTARLSDGVVVSYLCAHNSGMSRDRITPELIELKRQQIIMKRALKQFKAWRKEYESNNADVQREQRANEEAHGQQGIAELGCDSVGTARV